MSGSGNELRGIGTGSTRQHGMGAEVLTLAVIVASAPLSLIGVIAALVGLALRPDDRAETYGERDL